MFLDSHQMLAKHSEWRGDGLYCSLCQCHQYVIYQLLRKYLFEFLSKQLHRIQSKAVQQLDSLLSLYLSCSSRSFREKDLVQVEHLSEAALEEGFREWIIFKGLLSGVCREIKLQTHESRLLNGLATHSFGLVFFLLWIIKVLYFASNYVSCGVCSWKLASCRGRGQLHVDHRHQEPRGLWIRHTVAKEWSLADSYDRLHGGECSTTDCHLAYQSQTDHSLIFVEIRRSVL